MRASSSSVTSALWNARAASAFDTFFGYAAQNRSNSGLPSEVPAAARFFGATGADGSGEATLCPVVTLLCPLSPSPSAQPARRSACRSARSARLTAAFDTNSSKLGTRAPAGPTSSHPTAAIASAKPAQPAARSMYAAPFPARFPSASAFSWNLSQTATNRPTTDCASDEIARAIAATCDFPSKSGYTEIRGFHLYGMCGHSSGATGAGWGIPTGFQHCNRTFRRVQLKSPSGVTRYWFRGLSEIGFLRTRPEDAP
jgi:hypothetical protein